MASWECILEDGRSPREWDTEAFIEVHSKVEQVSWSLEVGAEFLLWLFNEVRSLYRLHGGPDDWRLADIAWTAPWKSSVSSDGSSRKTTISISLFHGLLVSKKPAV